MLRPVALFSDARCKKSQYTNQDIHTCKLNPYPVIIVEHRRLHVAKDIVEMNDMLIGIIGLGSSFKNHGKRSFFDSKSSFIYMLN